MNDQELSDLLRQAKAQTPKPSSQLGPRTVQAYRGRFARPSLFRRHWRLAMAAGVIVVVGGILATRPSTGSPLPPEYDRPGIVASGRIGSRVGWQVNYYTVVRPWRSGVHVVQFTGNSVTERGINRPVIFHRYLGDHDSKIYFGYDIVVQGDGKLNFRPLSAEPEEMPEQFHSGGARVVAIRELPVRAFGSGQNTAVTLLFHPTTGQQVIDYIHLDGSFIATFHHILGNIVQAVHSHFEPHQQDR